MAGDSPNGKVALRLFFMVIGTLFIWEAVPSTRWTYGQSPNIETGLWQTCSCQQPRRTDSNDCRINYSYLQGSYFYASNNCTLDPNGCTGANSNYQREYNWNHQFQYLFPEATNKTYAHNVVRRHHIHGAPYPAELFNQLNINNTYFNHRSNDCREYKGAGAIALVSYIFAFIGFLLVIKNVSANKVPIMDVGVYICAIMAGIWGLIATALFGNLFGKREGKYPLGHMFAIFTVGWILFFVVGITGAADAKKGAVTEWTSAIRSALFALALVFYAYGTSGNDWYVHDNQNLIVPLGGFQWTIKTGNFFIEPAQNARYITKGALYHYAQNSKGRIRGTQWCAQEPLLQNTSVPPDAYHLRNPNSNVDHLVGNQNPTLVESDLLEGPYGDPNVDVPSPVARRADENAGDLARHEKHSHRVHDSVDDHRKGAAKTRNHYPDQCLLPALPTIVRGTHVVGPFSTCNCKKTTSLTCTLFGSHWPMLNGREMKCQEFNVARAMILLVGIFSVIGLCLASMMVGGVRSMQIHVISNNMCMLSALLGLISSILYGAVVYDRHFLSWGFGLYVAGWWLLFLAGCIGIPLSNDYEKDVASNQIIPLNVLGDANNNA